MTLPIAARTTRLLPARARGFSLVLALTLTCAAAPLHADVSDAYQRSYDHEARGELMASLQALEAVPRAERDSYTYRLRHGWLLYVNGRHQDAIAEYSAAVELAPKAVEPRLGLMLPQIALRQWRAVEATARDVLKIDPRQSLAHARLGLALYSMGRYAQAEAEYQAVLELYPSDVETQLGVGFCQLGQREPKKALATFEAVRKVSPRDPRVRDGLAAARAAVR